MTIAEAFQRAWREGQKVSFVNRRGQLITVCPSGRITVSGGTK